MAPANAFATANSAEQAEVVGARELRQAQLAAVAVGPARASERMCASVACVRSTNRRALSSSRRTGRSNGMAGRGSRPVALPRNALRLELLERARVVVVDLGQVTRRRCAPSVSGTGCSSRRAIGTSASVAVWMPTAETPRDWTTVFTRGGSGGVPTEHVGDPGVGVDRQARRRAAMAREPEVHSRDADVGRVREARRATRAGRRRRAARGTRPRR